MSKKQKKCTHFWLRSEARSDESRTLLPPNTCKKLLDEGFQITVERSPHRIFSDHEYEKVGCTLTECESWPNAPENVIIVAVKELPASEKPMIVTKQPAPYSINHSHIHFEHVYKDQKNWKETLKRYHKGNGMLWDLEFLTDENGRRVAAYGVAAGQVGSALSLLQWIQQRKSSQLKSVKPWKSLKHMIKYVADELKEIGHYPKMIVLGALGRVGRGAVEVAEAAGVTVTKWDLDETKEGVFNFDEMIKHDILVNCIYATPSTPVFLNMEKLKSHQAIRKMTVLSDVSCDYTAPYNPFPVYNRGSDFENPAINVLPENEKPFDVIAIDHLPALIPSDASENFANDLFIHLLAFHDTSKMSDVWKRAEKLFREKMKLAIN